ncbi:gibberellin 20 oxidase 1-like [Fagus crenata]
MVLGPLIESKRSQDLVMALEIEEQHVESLSSMDHNLCVKNFIWSKEEWPAINYDEFVDGDHIPIISFRGILDEKKNQDYEILCQAMVNASSNWGFFKLVDHGVDLKIIENMKLRWNELFDLPMEQKFERC